METGGAEGVHFAKTQASGVSIGCQHFVWTAAQGVIGQTPP
jgi:hypothetical protein